MTMFEAILIAIIVGLLAYILLSRMSTKIIVIEPNKEPRKVRSDKGKKRGKLNASK